MTEHRHIRQLDGIRFLAITGVVVAHCWGPGPRAWIIRYWAHLGVRLFFVLSGFLISGILIRGRDLAEGRAEHRRTFIRRFYIRRFLRIFPVYYLVVTVVVAAGVPYARELWPWLVSYTTNLYIWGHREWIGVLGHFWTLAVEEQFYLVWPWLMLGLPRRYVVPLLVGLVALAPAYRFYASYHYSAAVLQEEVVGTFTAAALDSLGLGALLAIASAADPARKRLDSILGSVVLPAGLLAWLLLVTLSRLRLEEHISAALDLTAASLIFCWLIGKASRGFNGWFGRVLESRPVSYVGKISYGIYIFHNLVPPALHTLAMRLGIQYPETGVVNFAASVAVTLGLAATSWQFFEAPINNLKRYFPTDVLTEVHPSSAPPTHGRGDREPTSVAPPAEGASRDS